MDQKNTEAEQREMEEVAKSLNKSMAGIGTDEDRLIRELVKYNTIQRQLIKSKYLLMYGISLEEEISKEISGDFRDAVIGLLTPSAEFDAKCVKDAFEGAGTNENQLIEIICSKDAQEIKALRSAYKRLYNREIELDLKDEVGGDLGKLLRAVLSGGRAENHGYEQDLVKKEAQELYDAGQGKVGTDESVFIRILASRSYPQLNATFAVYHSICNTDFQVAVDKEFSGTLQFACMTIVKCVRNKPAYFAERIFETLKGTGTKEKDLTRLLVSRSDIDLKPISNEYKIKYRKTLPDAIKSEVNGDYQKLLLALLNRS